MKNPIKKIDLSTIEKGKAVLQIATVLIDNNLHTIIHKTNYDGRIEMVEADFNSFSEIYCGYLKSMNRYFTSRKVENEAARITAKHEINKLDGEVFSPSIIAATKGSKDE